MAKIEIDSGSGFCFGVTTAISKAEEELERTGVLYCLGDIVHNAGEVERLRKKGLITVDHEEFARLRNVKVLLRAHGEPPSTYETARRNNIEIIDATCPVVLQLQKRIKEAYGKSANAEGAGDRSPLIIIYGKPGHAEVNGLVGQTEGSAVVIQDKSDLDALDLDRDIWLYSQTTKSIEGFQEIVAEIRSRKRGGTFQWFDTICRQVANRMPKMREFAASHDVILFVSGAKSSNGKVLYAQCREVNPRTYLITDETELKPEWIAGAGSIGICGATSTPRWLMQRVAEACHIGSEDSQILTTKAPKDER
ncbi:MAG: 4-hydroxy-3-methylbut-2-enyl diphosphate reductase [Muribaculaceae bacterium]|nr:4-hydroxy-3-methylbut-2-enyl diphosphate reductase [Muribaculaceae bacterium]